MTIDEFVDITPFPLETRSGVVYVLFWELGEERKPFYVGRTTRFLGRMEDYDSAEFSAQTDFKVGEAIKFLKEIMGLSVVVGSRRSDNVKADEQALINSLHAAGVPLLNTLRGYRYKTADAEEQRLKVHEFCTNNFKPSS